MLRSFQIIFTCVHMKNDSWIVTSIVFRSSSILLKYFSFLSSYFEILHRNYFFLLSEKETGDDIFNKHIVKESFRHLSWEVLRCLFSSCFQYLHEKYKVTLDNVLYPSAFLPSAPHWLESLECWNLIVERWG